MKSKRILTLVIVLSFLFNFLGSSKMVSAEEGKKQVKINQTILEFDTMVYVDGTYGDDENGDGSKGKPFKTIVQGFDYLNENCRVGGAIVIKDGIYDVQNLFTGARLYNLKPKYSEMKLSLIAETMGKVQFNNIGEWIVIENSISQRIKLCMYGIKFGTVKNLEETYWLGADDWTNEYYNCVFPSGYGTYDYISTANIKVQNCLFAGTRSQYSGSVKGTALNCASTTQYIEPGKGTITNCLYHVSIDEDYNILGDDWKNAGEGKNPDGTAAHIGVYGGPFAWGSTISETKQNQLKVVMEPKEVLQLSVDQDLDANNEMVWTSSDKEVATVDNHGLVTAKKKGNAIITVTSEDGTYVEKIHILVVEDASEYRLAMDMKVHTKRRVTIDDLTDTKKVTWKSMDTEVATIDKKGKISAQKEGLVLISATDENGTILGTIYVRVRN